MNDLPNIDADSFQAIDESSLFAGRRSSHPPRILLLYGSLRQRSFSRLLAEEAARLAALTNEEDREMVIELGHAASSGDSVREDAAGAALLATDPKGYMGGFVQVAREYDGVELVGITSPLWPRTGTASGWDCSTRTSSTATT